MTQSNRETQRPGGRIQQIRDRMTKRSIRARDAVQNLTTKDVRSCCRRNAFVILTIAAVIIGIVLGFALRRYKMSYRQVKYFSFPGELLMRMLQMLVLPLLVSSLITGMAALDSRASGRMGIRAVVYYTTTTVIAVFIGIVMVIIIQPGRGGAKPQTLTQQNLEEVNTADAFLDLIRNMFPPNLVQACTQQFKTQTGKRMVTVRVMVNSTVNGSSEGQDLSYEEDIPVLGTVNSINALGLVVFSMSFGLIIGSMKEQGQPLRDFFDCLNDAIMRLVAIIMW
ncbi:solute carrier family 1 member 3a isoform X2 [Hemibagrus wyckioides]|nr:solute carrier family 1 member 3a isoform X2 [Hemibagrus wyckioides]